MKLSKTQRVQWRSLIRGLRERLPPPYPVVVRTCKMTKYDADTRVFEDNDGNRMVTIRIGQHLSFRERLHHLQHEYAHALDKSFLDSLLQIEEKCHTKAWGQHLASTYHVIQELVLFEHW